jgi:hypothetical protein
MKNKKTNPTSQASTAVQAKRRKSTQSSEEADEDDAECIFCAGKFSEDKSGEQWIKWLQSLDWCHQDCGGEREALNFICDLCKIQLKGFEVSMTANNRLFYQSSNVRYQTLSNILLKSIQSHGTQHIISYLYFGFPLLA